VLYHVIEYIRLIVYFTLLSYNCWESLQSWISMKCAAYEQ